RPPRQRGGADGRRRPRADPAADHAARLALAPAALRPRRPTGGPGGGAPPHPRHPAPRMTALFQHHLPPAPAMLPYVSGRFYASQHVRAVGGAVAMTANRLYAVPYVLVRPG